MGHCSSKVDSAPQRSESWIERRDERIRALNEVEKLRSAVQADEDPNYDDDDSSETESDSDEGAADDAAAAQPAAQSIQSQSPNATPPVGEDPMPPAVPPEISQHKETPPSDAHPAGALPDTMHSTGAAELVCIAPPALKAAARRRGTLTGRSSIISGSLLNALRGVGVDVSVLRPSRRHLLRREGSQQRAPGVVSSSEEPGSEGPSGMGPGGRGEREVSVESSEERRKRRKAERRAAKKAARKEKKRRRQREGKEAEGAETSAGDMDEAAAKARRKEERRRKKEEKRQRMDEEGQDNAVGQLTTSSKQGHKKGKAKRREGEGIGEPG